MTASKHPERTCDGPEGAAIPPVTPPDIRAGVKVADSPKQLLARLTGMTAMCHLLASQRKLNELVPQIVSCAAAAFPEIDFLAAHRDQHSGNLQLRTCSGNPQAAESVLESCVYKLAQLCRDRDTEGNHSQIWTILESADEPGDQTVLAAILGSNHRIDILLVGFVSGPLRFSKCDRELLTILGGFARGLLGGHLSIRELRKANRLLTKSSQQLAGVETIAALSDMTSGLAHDFNNIIGAVIGRVQLMKLKVADERLLKDLNKVESLLLEGARTVRSIQDFSTSTKYKKPETFDLVSLIAEYFSKRTGQWRKLAQKKAVRLTVRKLVDEALVEGSPVDLETVLEKLVENAVEYSYENGLVEIFLDDAGREYRLRVVDGGSGVSDEIAAKVFYPFFTTKQARGAGLGLAIVHGIVKRHSGSIELHSDPESGTVFEIQLPKAVAAREDSDVTYQGRKIRNLRILVVDDDEQIREVLTDMLAIGGHSVTTCPDGFSALETFRENEYDVVITDLGMEGMSGLDLAGLIHKDKPHVPVALITGWGSQLNHDEVALRGIKAVIAKPFHLDDINALVEKLAGSIG